MPPVSSPMAKYWIRRSFISAVLLGCGSTPSSNACKETFDLVVVSSDYSSTQVGGASLDGRVSMKGSVDLGADPALSMSAGRAFLLARDVGTIFELDPKCGAGIGRFSANDEAGGSTNPQDVAVASDGSLYITRFAVPSVLVLPANVRIDLSSLDDADGNPDMSGITTLGQRAYVALGRLDQKTLKSTRPSQIAVIDTQTRTVLQSITLAGRNPFGALTVSEGALWLAEPGNFDSAMDKDAGLERFDPASLTSKLVVPETSLGASAVEVAVSGNCAVAILADSSAKNRTTAVAIDIAKRQVSAGLLATADFFLRGLVLTQDSLVVGDRTKTDLGYALHVFKRLGSCTFQKDHDLWLPAPPIAFRAP